MEPKRLPYTLTLLLLIIGLSAFSQDTLKTKKKEKWKGSAHVGIYGGVNFSNYRTPDGADKRTDYIARPSIGFVGGVGTKEGFCLDFVDFGIVGYGSKAMPGTTNYRINTTHINVGVFKMGYRFRFKKDERAPGIELMFGPMNWLVGFNSKKSAPNISKTPIGFSPNKTAGLTILQYAFDFQVRFVATKWMSVDVRRTWAVLKSNRTDYWYGSNMYNRGWQVHLFFGLN